MLDSFPGRSEPLMQRSFLKNLLICSSGILYLTVGGLLPNEQAPVRYVDITVPSGLRFLHRNSATPSKFLIETMTGGVALFDYDNDGWLDVYFVNGAPLKRTRPMLNLWKKLVPSFGTACSATIMTGPFQT